MWRWVLLVDLVSTLVAFGYIAVATARLGGTLRRGLRDGLVFAPIWPVGLFLWLTRRPHEVWLLPPEELRRAMPSPADRKP